eukprot:529615-Rhodomonas_salina.1
MRIRRFQEHSTIIYESQPPPDAMPLLRLAWYRSHSPVPITRTSTDSPYQSPVPMTDRPYHSLAPIADANAAAVKTADAHAAARNKQDANYLATFMMDSRSVVILDI